jgi:hypothetical protein
MTIQETQEQLQEDLLSLLEGVGLEDVLDSYDWENLKNEVCEIVISRLKQLNK